MIRFKKAEITDIPNLNLLVNSAYRGDSSKLGWTTEADLLDGQRTDPDKLKEMIEDPNGQFELALEGNVILGCIYILKEPNSLYFGMLTVDPTLQNKGTGKLLMNRLEELAKAWGFKKIRMTVINTRQELIDYYLRRGYGPTGKTEAFPGHDPRFGIPKTNFFFLEFEKLLSE